MKGFAQIVVIFKRNNGNWTVLDLGTGLGEDDLRSEGVPETVTEWALTSGPNGE